MAPTAFIVIVVATAVIVLTGIDIIASAAGGDLIQRSANYEACSSFVINIIYDRFAEKLRVLGTDINLDSLALEDLIALLLVSQSQTVVGSRGIYGGQEHSDDFTLNHAAIDHVRRCIRDLYH